MKECKAKVKGLKITKEHTPSIAKIICVKNTRANMFCGIVMLKI
jgi:hypothetical protein